jgi:hypothetical protein
MRLSPKSQDSSTNANNSTHINETQLSITSNLHENYMVLKKKKVHTHTLFMMVLSSLVGHSCPSIMALTTWHIEFNLII